MKAASQSIFPFIMTSIEIRNTTTTIAVKKPGKNAGIRRNNNKKKMLVRQSSF